MSSFSSLHCTCPPLFNGIAYRMKKIIFWRGSNERTDGANFRVFCLTVECDFYAFLCARKKKASKVQHKEDSHNFMSLVQCDNKNFLTISISLTRLELYILFYDNELNFVDSLSIIPHNFFSSFHRLLSFLATSS